MLRHLALLLLGSAVAVSAVPAQAQDKGRDFSYSYYLIPCGTFVKHKESGPPTDIDNTSDLFYIAGWISAYNRFRPQSPIPEETSLDDVVLWMGQYCTDHPLSNVEAGLARLSVVVKHPGRDEDDDDDQASAPIPPPTLKKLSAPPAPAPAQPSPPFHVPVTGLKPLPE